jgi:hypothetical protein
MNDQLPINRAGDIATAGSVAAAGASWIAQVNALMTLLATVIAIVAGCFAIAVHLKTLKKN